MPTKLTMTTSELSNNFSGFVDPGNPQRLATAVKNALNNHGMGITDVQASFREIGPGTTVITFTIDPDQTDTGAIKALLR